jgi:hypothetical protein
MSPVSGSRPQAPCDLSSKGGLLLLRDHPDVESRLTFQGKWLLGNAFCPLIGRKGASARTSSFSRKLGGL